MTGAAPASSATALNGSRNPHAAPGVDRPASGTRERIDVCICTFRRPSIAGAIESVARQALPPGVGLRIIVADNDERPSARDLVLRTAAELGADVRYVHAPAANISVARNACLEASDSAWLAFMDDDETAAEDWLARLLAARDGADVVFGPSVAVYDSSAPRWMKRGAFHGHTPRNPNASGAPHTANVLIRRASIGDLRFDPALGRTGGEDTIFFHALWLKGARRASALDAKVFERVAPQRAKSAWLARRRFRAGQTHAHLMARFHPRRRATVLLLSALKIVYSVIAAVVSAPFPIARMRNAFRAVFHAGVIAHALGGGLYQEYQSPDRASSRRENGRADAGKN
jgi:succinoglycan biosynthesis protein ExoM